MKILVIDEDPAELSLQADLLAHAGHTVFGAGSTIDGVRFITNRQPDVIVADMAHLDGPANESSEVLRAMATIYDIPLVALGSESDRPWRDGIRGCAGFIPKPLDTRTFAVNVTRMARSAQPPAA